MDYIKAFVTGGIICALVQILMEKTKLMPGRIMVLLVVSRSHSGAVGIYEPFLSWAGAGASIPPSGLWKYALRGKTALAEEGVLGLFKGGLTAASAGITGALIFRVFSFRTF